VFSVRYELNLHICKFFKRHCTPKSQFLSCDVSVLLSQTLGEALCEGQSMHTAEVVCVAALAATHWHFVLKWKCPRMCYIRGAKWMC